MGAGRKTQTVNVDTRIPASESGHISARNLRKNDLGGAIFGCKHTTMPECLSKQLFGLPAAHFSYVRNIGPGLPIFHFNYSDRKLHGIYESASHGQMCIDAYAWSDGGAERTAFPAQVRIRVRELCKPLTENEFKIVIEDNYYTPQHFWFELDHSQTRSLISLFKPCPPTLVPVLNPFSQANDFPPLPISKWKSVKDVKATRSGNENKFAILSLDDSDDYGYLTKATSNATEENDSKEPVSNLEDLFEGHLLDGASSNIGVNFNEVPEILDKEPVDEEDYKNVLIKLERLSADCKVNSSRGGINESTRACIPEDLYNHDRQFLHDSCTLSEKNENLNAGNLHHGNVKKKGPFLDASMKEEQQEAVNCYDGNANRDIGNVFNESCIFVKKVKDSTSPNLTHGTVELLEAIRELKERTATLEKQQAESNAEIQHLRNLHTNSGQIIQLLSARFNAIESKIGTSMLLDDCQVKVVDQYMASEDLIYLIGGYSGSKWLSDVESFSPSLDILTPLKSMSYVCSHASVVALNGVIYVLGGGDGSSWYDTVERYDRRHDKWTSCPAMIHKKGSLAGATLNGKIYAIGGGDGSESFSDVEMFDPALGRWISWQSMIHKRFATAAAELNGAIYAVGGYDGQSYLKSAERLDPREVSCSIIPNMISRRGCHSMAVLNEKLFVMGGYDGEKMVSSVEIYDPRANAWMAGEPMKFNRGYGASAIVGNSLFIIGGIENGENIIDNIECYKEGAGWTNTRLKAVGKRCFFSAIVL